jgi:hypothetical protein
MPGVSAALAARPVVRLAPAGLAALVALAAPAGRVALLLAVLAVQAAVVAGFAYGAHAPVTVPAVALPTGVALAADAVLVARVDEPLLGPLVGIVSAGFVLAVLVQLGRRPPRTDLTTALTDTVAVAVVTAVAAGWLAVERGPGGADLVSTAAAAAAAGALVTAAVPDDDRLGDPRRRLTAMAAVALLGAVAGAAGGAVLGAALADVGAGNGTAVGAAVGSAVGLGVLVARALQSGTNPAPLLSASVPVTFGAPVAYALGRVLLG